VLQCVAGRYGCLRVLQIPRFLTSLFELLYRSLRVLLRNSKGSFAARQGSFGVLQIIECALFEKYIIFCRFKNKPHLTRWCIIDLFSVLSCVAERVAVVAIVAVRYIELQLLQLLQ